MIFVEVIQLWVVRRAAERAKRFPPCRSLDFNNFNKFIKKLAIYSIRLYNKKKATAAEKALQLLFLYSGAGGTEKSGR